MRIENEMLSRFNQAERQAQNLETTTLSEELDFFFDNVMETVVNYFNEECLSH